jgi:hypothetical protein
LQASRILNKEKLNEEREEGGREGINKRKESERFVEAFNIPVCMQDMDFCLLIWVTDKRSYRALHSEIAL